MSQHGKATEERGTFKVIWYCCYFLRNSENKLLFIDSNPNKARTIEGESEFRYDVFKFK